MNIPERGEFLTALIKDLVHSRELEEEIWLNLSN